MKDQSIEVSVIIVNYNTDKLTLQAVNSIYNYCKSNIFEIIVIDNNSKFTNLNTELALLPNTYFYKLEKNIGFGKANNFGYKLSKGRYVFLLNSDAYLIDENTIPTFINYLEKNNNVAIVGGNLITPDGKPNICHGKFLSVERVLHDYGLKKASQDYFINNLATARHNYFKEPSPVDYLTGAAIMIKRKIIENFGFFDPRYFIYLEDMELCYRYRKHGYFSIILPQVKLVHLGGQSSITDRMLNKRIAKEIAFSRYLFLRNITSWPVASGLFIMGKLITFYKRVKRKFRKIVYSN